LNNIETKPLAEGRRRSVFSIASIVSLNDGVLYCSPLAHLSSAWPHVRTDRRRCQVVSAVVAVDRLDLASLSFGPHQSWGSGLRNKPNRASALYGQGEPERLNPRRYKVPNCSTVTVQTHVDSLLGHTMAATLEQQTRMGLHVSPLRSRPLLV